MLDKTCAYYMAAGVSYDEFWNGDYTALKYSIDAYQIRKEEHNQAMWLQGYYFYDAVLKALANALPGKGSSRHNYIEKPIRITPLTEAEKEAEAEQTLEHFKAQLMALTGRLERREEARLKEMEAKKEEEAMSLGS